MHVTRIVVLAASTLLGSLGLLAGCASSSGELAAGQLFDDGLITTRVKSALFHQQGASFTNVNVDTRAGQVRLSGFVPNDEARRLAEQAARRVQGVKDVRNDLRVAPGG